MPSLAADPQKGENVLPEPAETLGAERQGEPALQGDRLVEPPAIPVQMQPDVRRAGLAQHVGEQPLPVDQPGLRIMPPPDRLDAAQIVGLRRQRRDDATASKVFFRSHG